jgi:hypothetical protein
VFVAADNWEDARAGLLSGERLLLQLQQLENAYLTGNRRTYEVTQSFPLSLVSPDALVRLRETGSCEFDLPEILFDVIYPGQYKRILRSVRLTVPGVVGPYTNIGVKLTLTKNAVRETPAAALELRPAQPNILSAIAASTGLNDGGQFELSFRDERYLPFEGAGAVSSWRLELPEKVRAFDYQTISDIVVHLSYTSLDDGAFRETVEAGLVTKLGQYATSTGMYRLLSLRRDFPAEWHRLIGGPTGAGAPAGSNASFAVTMRHFPYFLAQRDLTMDSMRLYLLSQHEVAGGGPATTPLNTDGLGLTLNGTTVTSWSTDANTGLATSTVPMTGPVAGNWTLGLAAGHTERQKVGDVLLLMRYKVA